MLSTFTEKNLRGHRKKLALPPISRITYSKVALKANFATLIEGSPLTLSALLVMRNNGRLFTLCRIAMVLLFLAPLRPVQAQTGETNLQLRLTLGTNALNLTVDGSASAGALFVYRADDPSAVASTGLVVVSTNTPITNGMRFSVPLPEG
ncbi:MAG TPA: hypothetical protein DCM86_19210, partial [Verrucomicrobiales bacterium]|nr:hypothetical protein [Verrucomicrobiales bacterium]